MKQYQNKKGFTLLEMSIVLLIIASITALIQAGQGLIHNAKLAGVIKEISFYDQAFKAFTLRYNALPGDMSNASSIWSSATNGNGNNVIDGGGYAPGFNTTNGSSVIEGLNAWNHLSLAGLVNGNYPGGSTLSLGSTYPASVYDYQAVGYYPIVNNQWSLYSSTDTQLALAKDNIFKHHIAVADAYQIDTKFDDSKPLTGRLSCWSVAWYGAASYQGNCTNYYPGGVTSGGVAAVPQDQRYYVVGQDASASPGAMCSCYFGLYDYVFIGNGR